MASIISTSINLNEIPKDKIIKGEKGSYINLTITLNDEVDKFGNNGPVTVNQTKEERESKASKKYLGNAKVVWTNGKNVEAGDGGQQKPQPRKVAEVPVNDLPF